MPRFQQGLTRSRAARARGRDKGCDLVIMRKEVSRHHALLRVDPEGAVWVESLGREPVAVNGKPATEPTELFSGDQVEVRPGGPQLPAPAPCCAAAASAGRTTEDAQIQRKGLLGNSVCDKLYLSNRGLCYRWQGEAAVLRALC